MRRHLSSLSLVCAGLAALLAPAAGGASAGALQKWIAAGDRLTIVDVRLPAVFAAGHIPGAINIPASLCPYKNLPFAGKVIVYDDGVRSGEAARAAAALARNPGAPVEILEGGYAAWESTHALTTAGRGLKPETSHYVSYQDLKSSKPGSVVLVDLRRDQGGPLTDLAAEFPGLEVVKSAPDGGTALVVFVDSADGAAGAAARRLKASGNTKYAILAGGELSLARQGKRGSQRIGSSYRVPVHPLPKQ
jgi:rhodanese-related sulfurtransferase